MTHDKFRQRLIAAVESGDQDTELGKAIARWKGHDFTVKRNGRWCVEGFIKWFIQAHELLRAVDPTAPAQLPPHVFDPAWIARMHGIPEQEFGLGQATDRLGVLEARVSGLESALQCRTTVDPTSQLNDREQMLLRAASESEPMVGRELADKAGITFDANARTCLSTLVKLSLLVKVGHGYVRAPHRPLS